MSELRWHPLLGEWVATATRRQTRTFLPPADFCPLCPTKPGGFPTEIPEPNYDIVVFENRFPSLSTEPPAPSVEATELYPVRPSKGVCEVVVYSPRHTSTLADEPVEQIYKLIQVWTDRFRELSALDFVDYVFIFENKGEAIGVTLHHPHGQIYAYPFIPPRIARELERSRAHMQATGRCLVCDILAEERRDGRRIVCESDSFVAAIPFFARYPYEVNIFPVRHLQALTEMTDAERRELAATLKQVLMAYDKLFDLSFPYMMVLHGRPSDGGDYEHYHFHIEFYPPLRAAGRLKYLAGSETGAGMFINDTHAEEKAAELRAHIAPVHWKTSDK
ncbi:MAG TPA: galactose-1-phosphate uridylyltransferase [Pyrinomonadaceae bacterium]|nr:galactose-1-phosphate uridylyltransferase [Pyrinomonadaceae bacterium]